MMNKCSLIEAGIKAGGSGIYEEDKIWSRYSHDKVDIGEALAKVIRTLNRVFPLAKELRALSVGSSAEPQFRILETNFLGGLYLLDIEKSALDIVRERLRRQCTGHVTTIPGDYNKIFLNSPGTDLFLKQHLGGKRIHLVTLHHSLYYCPETKWNIIFGNLYRKILDK
ncbi:MAG: class I SAM-dependent methyltransferase, partial [Candidatus Omnitrophota bacterium]|nr:class I SAM-dependent methyltransferase [Candidatus Omnitrophota bacterium]